MKRSINCATRLNMLVCCLLGLMLGVPRVAYANEQRVLSERSVQSQEIEESKRLNSEAVRLYQAGKYDEALSLVTRVLVIAEKAFGPEHPNVADVLSNLASLYRAKGDYPRAEPLLQRSLAIREKVLGPEHPDVAQSLNNLATLYEAKGEPTKAEPLYRRSLAISEKVFGPDHPDVARLLKHLAGLYGEKGDYGKGEPLYLRSLAIYENAVGQSHPDVAGVLAGLGRLYYLKGDFAKAEPPYLRSLAIREKTLGPDHLDVAGSLNDLGLLYQAKADFAKAEPLFERSLAIAEKALGSDHPTVATALNNLGMLHQLKGDSAKAEPLFQRSLAISEKTLGPDHPFVALFLDKLALLYYDKEDYAKAEPLYLRSLTISEKTLGLQHPQVAYVLNSLARLYEAKGDNAKAEPLYQRSLAISEKALGPDHPDFATVLNNLALLYQKKGNFALVEPLLQRSLSIREKALGPNHPDVATALVNLAVTLTAQGNTTQAVAFLARSNDILERNISRNIASGSEREKLLYLATLTYATISVDQSDPNRGTASRLALTTLLRRKGRTLDAMTDSTAQLRRNAAPQDRALLDQLAESRARLATVTFNGPGKIAPVQYRANLKLLDEQMEKLESEISARSAEFRAQTQPITLDAVQKAIPPGAVLVEFKHYYPYHAKTNKSGSPRYVVYTLTAQGEPLWVDLGEAEPIQAAIAALRAALRDPKRTDVKQLARALDAKVMQPVRKLIGDSHWLLISPDDALNLIPFGALVDEQDHYLIEKYLFTYLTSGRDLLRLQVPLPSKQGPMVVANPDFGQRVGTEAERKVVHQPEQQVHAFSRFYFPALPGTAAEGEALRAILPKATVLTQRQATKTALKQVDRPEILHIATHGFFLEDLKLPPPDMRALHLIRNDSGRLVTHEFGTGAQVENPLLRSGLALAGANEHKTEDDGILTALETAGLNLWGTKLVVLSACDTGVGEVRTGEGVYGLRRALVLAGSESQVMSLWPVNDEATRDLMVDYYKALQAGQGRSEGLRQVQLRMLSDPKRSHPAYWASFIQSGQWKNLAGTK